MNKRTESLRLFRQVFSAMAGVVMVVFFSASLSANAIFHATRNDIDGNLDATVTFSNVNCAVACGLNITLQNNIADPVSLGDLISDLTSALSNRGSFLNFTGYAFENNRLGKSRSSDRG
jgi:hypothetical protein